MLSFPQSTMTNLRMLPVDYPHRHRYDPLALATARVSVLVAMTNTVACNPLYIELSQAGYDIQLLQTGNEVLAALEQTTFDLILLHTELADMNAFQLCTKIRAHSSIPIVMIAEQKSDLDLIYALSLGADAYMAVPLSFAEFHARLQAVLRRAGHIHDRQPKFLYTTLTLDLKKRMVNIRDEAIQLTQIEYRMLNHLLAYANAPVTKEQLVEVVWGYTEAQEVNFIEVAVRRLRQKIERNPSKPEYLVTVRGIGYQLNLNPTPSLFTPISG
jgi:DNA-binding response OmpR family regulator